MATKQLSGRGLLRGASLFLSLYAFWLALSGHYTPFLMTMGALCALFVVYVAARMGTLDAEGHPVHLIFGAVTYFPWLIWQITKSAIAVTRIILSPGLPVSPTMTTVKAGQKTPVGVGIYANSITLTPGTITVGVKGGNELVVHALEMSGAADLEAGAMDKRVSRFEATGGA